MRGFIFPFLCIVLRRIDYSAGVRGCCVCLCVCV